MRTCSGLFVRPFLCPYRLTYVVGFLWLLRYIADLADRGHYRCPNDDPQPDRYCAVRVEVKALIGEYWNRMQNSKD